MFFHRRKRDERELARAQMEARLQAEMAAMAVAQLAEMRDQYEKRIADLKEAHEKRHEESMRVVKSLADQVEFLRAKHYGPVTAATPGFTAASVKSRPEPDFMPGMAHSPFFLTEDEEDLLALKDGGFIDAVEHQQAMAQLRAATGGIPITVEES